MFIGTAFWQQPTTAVSGATQSFQLGIFLFGTSSAVSGSKTASTWTQYNHSYNFSHYRISYSETQKLYMTCAENNGPILRSSDMTVPSMWTQSVVSSANRDIQFNENLGLWIAVGRATFTTGNITVRTSPDGTNFTTQSTPAIGDMLETVFWSGGTQVAVSQAGGSGANNGTVITSTDGLTWTQRTAGATSGWHGGVYSPERNEYLIGGIGGFMATSSDAISWRVYGRTGGWRYFAWSPELKLYVGTRTGGTIAYSSDASSWTASNTPSGNYWNVIWSSEERRFYATRITTQTRPVWYSSDGASWTQSVTTLTSGSWVGFAYRKEIL